MGSFFRFILALFVVAPFRASASIPYLDSGEPGCLKFVIDRPMNDSTAAQLNSNCKQLRAAYLESLKSYSGSPAKFEKELTAKLKGPAPAYRAILLSALYHDVRFVPALETRAKNERAKKSKDLYASAALERVKTGRCSSVYQDERYDEICRLASPVVSRVIELSKGAR